VPVEGEWSLAELSASSAARIFSRPVRTKRGVPTPGQLRFGNDFLNSAALPFEDLAFQSFLRRITLEEPRFPVSILIKEWPPKGEDVIAMVSRLPPHLPVATNVAYVAQNTWPGLCPEIWGNGSNRPG